DVRERGLPGGHTGLPGEAPAPVPGPVVRVAVLSSTPPSPTEGSGTFVAVDGLIRGLTRLGHEVGFRRLGPRSGFHTLDRLVYNVAVAARPPVADVVVGVALDGFWCAHRGGPRADRSRRVAPTPRRRRTCAVDAPDGPVGRPDVPAQAARRPAPRRRRPPPANPRCAGPHRRGRPDVRPATATPWRPCP